MASPDTTAADCIEIRKYPNRRYYDTSRSRHLTLEDIRQLIRQGANVRIIDSQTGADITSRTLTQMILEFDASKLDLFTVPLLTELIRVNDQVMKGFFEKFFHQALASFFGFQKHLERQLRTGSILPSLFPPFPSWPGTSKAEMEEPNPGPPRVPGTDVGETVRRLERQVAALKRQLDGPSRRKKRLGRTRR